MALFTGPPGSGKSYCAVRQIVDALDRGKIVATNVALLDGWELQLARRSLRRRLTGTVDRKADELRRRMFVSSDLDELFRLRLRGDGESRGVMVLDEAHNWLNARTWDHDETGKSANRKEAINRRLRMVRFFSQHRKLGWDVLLLTQDADNLDAQVRRNFEYHVRLKNLRRFRVLGIPVVPVNFFLAIWCWNDAKKTIVKRNGYRLIKKVARLYDTMALSHGEDQVLDVIMLPLEDPPPPRHDPLAGTTRGWHPDDVRAELAADLADELPDLPRLPLHPREGA